MNDGLRAHGFGPIYPIPLRERGLKLFNFESRVVRSRRSLTLELGKIIVAQERIMKVSV